MRKRYFLLSNATLLLFHWLSVLCNERRIQGGHLEYLINNFPWNYSLGVEFILRKGRERHGTNSDRDWPLRNRLQIPFAFRACRFHTLCSQKVRKINCRRRIKHFLGRITENDGPCPQACSWKDDSTNTYIQTLNNQLQFLSLHLPCVIYNSLLPATINNVSETGDYWKHSSCTPLTSYWGIIKNQDNHLIMHNHQISFNFF